MSESYYGRPIVKPHVWKGYIPLYLWVGGAAGAAATLGAVARATGNGTLARSYQRVALAGTFVAPALLVADLGVPLRFINMLRVVKPTSPMNVGSWILAAFGAVTTLSAIAERANVPRVPVISEIAAGAIGPALTCYTGVLLADTATPIWYGARFDLPLVFAANGFASAGALATATGSPAARRAARKSMIGGTIAMLLAMRRMQSRLGPVLAEPYRRGVSGRLMGMSKTCALLGVATGLCAGRTPLPNRVAATLIIAAGVLERFAIVAAGTASALDPRYVVESQR